MSCEQMPAKPLESADPYCFQYDANSFKQYQSAHYFLCLGIYSGSTWIYVKHLQFCILLNREIKVWDDMFTTNEFISMFDTESFPLR